MWKNFKDAFNDFFGTNDDIKKSVELAIEDRLVSPFYGYFLFSWMVVNWDFLYAAFFTSQEIIFEKTGLNRYEFLLQHILPINHSKEWFVTFIILPFIITVVFFWLMPFVTQPFYVKNIRNKKKLERIKIKELAEKTEAEAELIRAETEIQKAEQEAEKSSPQIIWNRDFREFQKTDLYRKFYQIVDSIYKFGGWIKNSDGTIDTDILVYSDSNGLITIGEDNFSNPTISATEKGKHFFKMFIEDPKSQKERYPF